MHRPFVLLCFIFCRSLKVLKDDIDTLVVYLNDSYNSNEFYLRDVVAFTMNIIDEMAIRNHIDSLPAIINEIWDVMGESGKVIQKSIMWIIETVRQIYLCTSSACYKDICFRLTIRTKS